MSARAQRNDQSQAHDSQWLEFPDSVENSPASVWASDDDDEITFQSSRIATEQPQQLTADTEDHQPSAGETRPRALLLDESQVLPSEASFATVRLHQQVELTAVPGREQQTTSRVAESVVNESYSRTRTLDVSHVLPGEVSFATVMLNQETAGPYSPLREFLAKSGLNWSRLMVEALLLVSVSAVVAMVAYQVARQGAFSSNRSVSNSAETPRSQAEPTVIQPELPTPGSPVSAAVSNEPTPLNDHASSAPENAAKLEAAVDVAPNKFSGPLPSEGSRIAASDETKLKVPSKISQQEGKSRTRNSVSVVESKPKVTQQQLRPSEKETEAGNRETRTESGVNNPRSQTVDARRESSSLSTNASSGEPKAATTTSAPVTGGGQRPRTVTRKVDP